MFSHKCAPLTIFFSAAHPEFMIQDMAVKEGMLTMAQDGLLKALEGKTSVDEVLAVANIDSTLLVPNEDSQQAKSETK